MANREGRQEGIVTKRSWKRWNLCGWFRAWLGTRLVLWEMFPLDFSEYGRGWAQRDFSRNCSPRFLL